ncbi:hypothetical protein AJ78_07149 [Emergomyces pasteurianus Ep9510]|uniref:Uncharacterized protein n=1 Tax=Emergomyces pasteurianus Ep9510 TaxID=1447872 RepID=A0A1J9P701_9EURO|nr:hypothetical protein AJ78_07149 [Emergomyces pasteurianus Ep9510]
MTALSQVDRRKKYIDGRLKAHSDITHDSNDKNPTSPKTREDWHEWLREIVDDINARSRPHTLDPIHGRTIVSLPHPLFGDHEVGKSQRHPSESGSVQVAIVTGELPDDCFNVFYVGNFRKVGKVALMEPFLAIRIE